VYRYDPIPDELTPEESRRVLGTQVCLWSEFVPTAEHAEYMLYPRTLAHAEVGWSRPERKDWARFQKAVESHFSRLDRDGVNYSTNLYNVAASLTPDPLRDEITVTLRTESLDAEIFYTVDNGEPSARAHRYTGVLQAERGSVIKAALFDREGRQLGKVTEVVIE
jgi:hexosaminidase